MEDTQVGLEALSRRVAACRRCPRLVAHRERVAEERHPAHRDEPYWGRPVPGFGDPEAQVLIVGLAPAAHGANRTGRMFTGDGPRGASDFLMASLHRAGLASLPASGHQGDGLVLRRVYVTAVVRCAPPGNRPTAAEMGNCLPYLAEEQLLLPGVRAVVALGRVAFAGCLRALFPREEGVHPRAFAHGGRYALGEGLPNLIASYHPSRQNTQTGRLTSAMLDAVLSEAMG